ncbi:MAG: HNH endonuclease [Candidatus Dadabacteria bacterium]|nr:HNH endonuclease [Candidatus Dadabacteria bacterium]NIS07811.1 HNH endonuclease [Candidatus Dadabacteria bacterium]NIV43031.1 HNH endonuclease [Candidatus Dadabacteria bacterium]NIY21429.1 HNH endonuclease [Candidatus Dadabacteria bacterium]
MKDQIISYREMCDIENVQTLQRGMNYRLNPNYSVILMSQRQNAPYKDKILSDGYSIEYEGHDIPKTQNIVNPKLIDQPRKTKSGKLTQNALFAKAVEEYRSGKNPEFVRVFEKIFPGIWSEKGFFNLIDYKYEKDDNSRFVFEYIPEETEIDLELDKIKLNTLRPRSRVIPSEIKRIV